MLTHLIIKLINDRLRKRPLEYAEYCLTKWKSILKDIKYINK